MTPRRAQGLVRWIVVAAVVAVGGVVAFFALGRMRAVVTVTEAVEGPVVQAFYATGTVSPEREYPVKSNAAGFLEQVLVDKGDAVRKGQPLAVVAEPELQFQLDQAKAELAEKRARADAENSPVLREYAAKIRLTNELLEIARREQLRISRLLEQGAANETDLDRALDRVKELSREAAALDAQQAAKALELRKDLEVAEAAVTVAETNLELQTLRSPVDGVVLDRPVAQGTRLAVNDPVMTVADVDLADLVMRAQVDEENIAEVRAPRDGAAPQTVRMTLYSFPGRVFTGTVHKVYNKADPDRRTFEVDVKLPDAGAPFAAGMTGELAFEVAAKGKALVVPSQALQDGQVWVVRGGRLEAVAPEVGLRGVERVELLSDLRPGDRVVISPAAGLEAGKPVRTAFMDPVAAAGLNKPKEKEIFRGGF